MTLTPLTGQIHVRPDPSPTHTEGGIQIPDAYQAMPSMSGTVIAVGPADLSTQRRITAIRARAIRECLMAAEEVADTFRHSTESQMLLENLARILRTEPPAEPGVQVGDRVLYAGTSGNDVVIGEDADSRTIILRESDVLVVVESEQEVAA